MKNNPPDQPETKKERRKRISHLIATLDPNEALAELTLLKDLTKEDLEEQGRVKEMFRFMDNACMASVLSTFTTPSGKASFMIKPFLYGKSFSFFYLPLVPLLKNILFGFEVAEWVEEVKKNGFRIQPFLRLLWSFVETLIIDVAIILPMIVAATAVAVPYLFLSAISMGLLSELHNLRSSWREFRNAESGDKARCLGEVALNSIGIVTRALLIVSVTFLFAMAVTNPVSMAIFSTIGLVATVIAGAVLGVGLYKKRKQKLEELSRVLVVKNVLQKEKLGTIAGVTNKKIKELKEKKNPNDQEEKFINALTSLQCLIEKQKEFKINKGKCNEEDKVFLNKLHASFEECKDLKYINCLTAHGLPKGIIGLTNIATHHGKDYDSLLRVISKVKWKEERRVVFAVVIKAKIYELKAKKGKSPNGREGGEDDQFIDALGSLLLVVEKEGDNGFINSYKDTFKTKQEKCNKKNQLILNKFYKFYLDEYRSEDQKEEKHEKDNSFVKNGTKLALLIPRNNKNSLSFNENKNADDIISQSPKEEELVHARDSLLFSVTTRSAVK